MSSRRGSAPSLARSQEPGAAASERSADGASVYVYGIIPADATLDSGLTGVGDPPGAVKLIRLGQIAAVCSEVSAPWSLGSPPDLTRHAQILDGSAAAVPVLPMRFGTILPGEDDVARELLGPNHDVYAAALAELAGRAQFVVKGRYAEEAILREVLSENAEAARLRERIRAASAPGLARNAQIRLGEIISRAITAKRENDTRMLAARLDGHCDASVVRQPRHERDAVQMAVLVRTDKLDWLQQTVGDLARQWHGRVDLRLLGPMAAYDFVATTETGGA